jgi:hypothetical protein
MTPKDREALKGIGDTIKQCIPPNVCFVLFLHTSAGSHYLSNGHRDDVLNALEEWLTKTSGQLNVEKSPETSEHVDSRLELERLCAHVGEGFASITKIALLLFSFGEGGSSAWYTNVERARENIAAWVKERRGLS